MNKLIEKIVDGVRVTCYQMGLDESQAEILAGGIKEEAKAYNEEVCEWRLCDEEANVYDTTCRNPHILIEGSPIDNNYEFCPYCGKKIKVIG